MTDKPPSDPANHAVDFARRYAHDLEIATGEVMLGLGLSNHEMGLRDPSSHPAREILKAMEAGWKGYSR